MRYASLRAASGCLSRFAWLYCLLAPPFFGLQPHDLRPGQQVAAKAVQIALKARAVEIILQVAGVGGAADIQQIALGRETEN